MQKFKLDQHDNIEKFIEKVDEKLEGLEILVNNAGITLDNLSIRLSQENWKKVLDINLTSTFLMCKHSIKKMLKKNMVKLLTLHQLSHTQEIWDKQTMLPQKQV